MNTSINFEIAKLLKEKGFDEPTLNWYHKDTKKFNINDLMFSMNKITDNYSAPTIADVIMWLYEKYGIWIVVNIAIDNLWYFELYNLKDKRNAEIPIQESFYTTPSEAYQEAINYTFKNLIK